MQLQRSLDLFYRDTSSPLLLSRRSVVMRNLALQVETTRKRQWDIDSVNGLSVVMLSDTIKQILANDINPTVYDNDADRYTLGIVPQLGLRENLYDPVLGRSTLLNWFYTDHKTKSLVIPVEADQVFETYPIDGDWSNYRPFRMVDTDASSLSLNILGGQLNYKDGAPNLSVFTWDLAASVLQYLYLNNLEALEVETYVRRYCLLPAFIEDNINLWLLNEYTRWIAGDNPVYSDIDFKEALTFKPSGFDQLHREAKDLVDVFRHSSKTPSKLINGLPLLSGESISDWYHTLSRQTTISEGSNFSGIYFLKNRKFLTLALYTCALNPRMPDSTTFLRVLHRDTRYMRQTSPVSNLTDTQLRSRVGRLWENFCIEVDSIFDIL